VLGLGADADILIDSLEVVAGTSPSDQTSARALLMNNQEDMVGIHESATLQQQDTENFGPSLAQLRHGANWGQDQIDFGTGWFRAEDAGGTAQNYSPNFDSTLYFDTDGIMHVEYGDFLPTGEALPVAIEREYAMVPGQPLLVERWTFENQRPVGEADITWSFMNMLGLPEELAQRAVWDERRETFIVELGQGEDEGEAAEPLYLAFGAFQEMDGSEAATRSESEDWTPTTAPGDDYDPSATVTEPAAGSVIDDFRADGAIDGETRADGEGLGLAMAREEINLRAGRPTEFYFYYTMADSLDALDTQIGQALNPQGSGSPGSPAYWFNATAASWSDRLEEAKDIPGTDAAEAGGGGTGSGAGSGGVVVDGTDGGGAGDGETRAVADPALEEAYERSLVTILQSQQPEFGSFVAATNPAYDFKVWPRDSAVTAMGLDAAGLHDDAGRYWKWMASVEEDGDGAQPELFENGTCYTNYSYWDANVPIDFVQPEWDSQGLFLAGVYKHWAALNEAGREDEAEAFVQDETIREAFVDAAEFIRNGIDETGFGPQDFSIWEEIFLYNGFTQVTYASGLQAASLLADEIGRPDLADEWAGASDTIREAILRPTTDADFPGLWNEEAGRFVWGVTGDGEVVNTANAAIDLMFVTGLLDVNEPQAQSQIDWITENLSKNTYGISRYEGDRFYAASPYSPGGAYESRVTEAAWPQMTSYIGMAKEFQGDLDWAYNSLEWTVSRYGQEFMPPGEGVDWSTREPLPSTMVEPVTGAWYILNLLNYTDQYDPRLPESNPAQADAMLA
jgi:hypothetical protein